MREIKFRAWEKTLNEMIPVNNIDFIKQSINTDSAWRFLPEIELMQYTGLKDMNGVEIYEGDIYHMGDPKITYTVIWQDTGLKGKQNSSTSYAGLLSWQERIEIIGNIYENPELLEVAE